MAGDEEFPFNGERLREVREARDLSQAALGKAVRRSQGYISNLEMNYSPPPAQEVDQLEAQLRVAPGTLRQHVGDDIEWLHDETAEGLARLLPYFSTLPVEAQRAVLQGRAPQRGRAPHLLARPPPPRDPLRVHSRP